MKRLFRSPTSSTNEAEGLKKQPRIKSPTLEGNMADAALRQLIEDMGKRMDTNFGRIHSDMDSMRCELKSQIDAIKVLLGEVEKSLDNVWSEVETLKQSAGERGEREKELEAKITKVEADLAVEKKMRLEEKEKRISLEAYTRRENLHFKNIEENHDENCKEVVQSIIQRELGINVQLKFGFTLYTALVSQIPKELALLLLASCVEKIGTLSGAKGSY